MIPGISFALVPRNYLGEALFTRTLYTELRGSHSALGSDADFVQARVSGERVFDFDKIPPSWHVYMRADIGATAVSSTSGLAPSQRFFAGGDRSVRGFGLNDLSPVEQATDENGDPLEDEDNPVLEKVGGKHMFAGSVELIRDLPNNFAVAVFGDVGNAFDKLRRSAHVLRRRRHALPPAGGVGGHRRGAGADHSRGQQRASRPAPASQFLAQVVMKRRLKIAALCFGLFILLVVSFLAWVIYTEAGLRFAVDRLPEKMGKVTLRIEDVRGTIAGGFSAAKVDVNHERSHVYIENAAARVNFWPLLVGRISVRSAAADLVQIEVKRRIRPPPDTPPKFLPRLLSISAERATARSLIIIAPNGKRVEFADVNGAGIVGHKTIRIFEGNVVYGVLRSRAIGELRAANPTRLSGEATTRMIIEGQPEWLARDQLRWRPGQTTADRQAADAVPRRPERRAAGDEHEFSLARRGRGAQLRPERVRRR